MHHSVRRSARLFAVVALALCVVAPAATQARSRPAANPAGAYPVLELSIGTRCLDGDGFVAHDTVQLIHSRGSTTLGDVTFKTSGSHFKRCLAKPVLAGDRVRFVRKVGTKVKQNRTIAVPDLRITGDIGANTLTVDASLDGVPITTYLGLGVSGHIAGLRTNGLGTAAILDEAGHSEVHMEWYSWTLQVGDVASTSYATPADDTIYRWWSPATMTAQVGKAAVTGSGKPATAPKLTLKAAGGATRATATARVGAGLIAGQEANESSPLYAATLAKDGASVPAKAGNTIVSSAMDPDGARLLANDFQATAGEDDATLTGTCRPDSRVAIAHGVNVQWTFDSPSGEIDRSDLWFASGERIVIGCQTADGYGQRFVITVP